MSAPILSSSSSSRCVLKDTHNININCRLCSRIESHSMMLYCMCVCMCASAYVSLSLSLLGYECKRVCKCARGCLFMFFFFKLWWTTGHSFIVSSLRYIYGLSIESRHLNESERHSQKANTGKSGDDEPKSKRPREKERKRESKQMKCEFNSIQFTEIDVQFRTKWKFFFIYFIGNLISMRNLFI